MAVFAASGPRPKQALEPQRSQGGPVSATTHRRAPCALARGHGPSSMAPRQAPDPQVQAAAALCLRVVLATSSLALLSAAAPLEAQARGWRPRRHLAKRADVSVPTKQAGESGAAQRRVQAAPRAEGVLGELQGAISQLGRALRRGYSQTKQTATADRDGGFEIVVAAPGQTAPLPRRARRGDAGAAALSPLGWAALALAAAVAAAAVLRLRLPWAGGRRGEEKGRWVRDRSLGGKMVFIPDVPIDAPSPGKAAQLWGDDAAWGAAPPPAAVPPPAAAEAAPPAWWPARAPAPVYCSPARLEELQRTARAVVRDLEDAKVERGADYALSSLREVCLLSQEGNGFAVRAATDSGRDAMLRSGVRAALAAAQERSASLLGGTPPGLFVCQLAGALGVPAARAVQVAHAEVAAASRALLIDAEAAFRSGQQAGVVNALVKLSGLLEALPLPAGSAEAELVAAGVRQQTTLQFRQNFFLAAGSVSEPAARLIAELLGFDPDLVMPQLDLARAAEQAAQQAWRAAAAEGQ